MSARGAIERTLHDVWKGQRRWLALLFWPLSVLYSIGSRAHRLFYALGLLKRIDVGVPIISVGNLIVGGAGKTPVTLEIARRLLAAGRRVAVVSRGYGRLSSSPIAVVSDGEAIRGTAAECGDEPLWLARKLPGLMVVVGADRAKAATTAVELGADIVVLDDGFSHHRLVRTVDVLVMNADGGLGNGRTLPAGPMREPKSAASRATHYWLSRVDGPDANVPTRLPARPTMRSSYAPAKLVTLELSKAESLDSLRNKRVLGICGIAQPDNFRTTLTRTGAIVRDVVVFPDHHPFSRQDVESVQKLAVDERCEFIITTEKDAMRLIDVSSSRMFRAIEMETELVGDASALEALIRRFSTHADPAEAA